MEKMLRLNTDGTMRAGLRWDRHTTWGEYVSALMFQWFLHRIEQACAYETHTHNSKKTREVRAGGAGGREVKAWARL